MLYRLTTASLLFTSLLLATVHEVSIQDFAFSPATLEVQAGDSVRWTNNDASAHTATGANGEWDSGSLSNGQSFTFQFNTAGSFAYLCSFHPSMTANINTSAVGIDDRYNNPESFKLLSAYPNPFNPTVSIPFSTEKTTNISMAVYDITGAVVKDFGQWLIEPGNHIKDWHGENDYSQLVSSGTYIVTLHVNQINFSQKLLLIR